APGGSEAVLMDSHLRPPSCVTSTVFLLHAAQPLFSSAKYTRQTGAGGLGSFFQSLPNSSVFQIPFSVTIQPKVSFRKNSDTGFSSSFTTSQCAPPSVVTTDTGLWPPLLSCMVPTAMTYRSDGVCMSC